MTELSIMTIRQKILKFIYPLFTRIRNLSGHKKILSNAHQKTPLQSFYALSADLTNGKTISFESLRGKKVLIVNTASDCGYTAQYEELQKLYRHSREDLEIIAFPANDFKEQEPGSDEEIEQFCKRNYGVGFPIARKSIVVRSEAQHKVFQWLTDPHLNGWNHKAPRWNFTKYLVNEEGVLTHCFDPSVSPVGEDMLAAVHG